MKTLILKSEKDSFESYFLKNMHTNDAVTFPVYATGKSEILHYMSVLWMKYLKLPFESIWYSSWKKHLQDYDCVIVFDRVHSWRILKYIHRHHPNCRIIFWYWNTIDGKKNRLIDESYREYCEIWSFDKNDCHKYNLKYNIQFYFFQPECSKHIFEYDLLFVGRDKGRIHTLEKINRMFMEAGLKPYIKVIRDVTSQNIESELYSENEIFYEQLLTLIQKSKAILEVSQATQNGLTMRVLECLYHQKKLITTEEQISEYPFYDPNNVLILREKTTISDISNFMKTPWKKIERKILSDNSFEQWLKNFQ